MDRDILFKLETAVSAGQFDKILRFDVGKSPPKHLKKSILHLENSKNWRFDGFYIIHACGVSMPAIASWQGRIGIQLQNHEYRYRLLAFDRGGCRAIFAIPIAELDRVKTLPGIDLDPTELKLLLEMAEDLYDAKHDKEVLIRIKQPAKDDLLQNAAHWKAQPYDENELLDLLEREPVLLPILIAAVDSQLRGIKRCHRAPPVLFNFIADAKNVQAAEVLLSTLRSVTFSIASTSLSGGPIDLQVKEICDLEAWRKSPGRLAVLHTATGSLLRPIFDELEDRARIEKCGGLLPDPLPSLPIVISRNLLHNGFSVDVELPKDFSPLTLTEAKCLRAAASRLMNRPFIERVYHNWRHTMERPEFFMSDASKVWKKVLSLKIIDILFKNPQLHHRAKSLLMSEAEQQAELEQQRREMLQRAIELITSPEHFSREIVDRPSSKSEAEAVLSGEALAFRFCPAKGSDQGKHLLAFSKRSLSRLLKRVSMPDTYHEAFLAECEKRGIMDNRNRTINLGGESFYAVTFSLEK